MAGGAVAGGLIQPDSDEETLIREEDNMMIGDIMDYLLQKRG